MTSALAPLAPGELGGARLLWFAETSSTMDVAHDRASQGEGGGLLVVADEQTAGRGRSGSAWRSHAGEGLWFTLMERPAALRDPGVLSLRAGLAIARALDPFAGERVRVKWPNDLYLASGKLAGVLVEARWREGAVEWVAIGVGINLRSTQADGALHRAALLQGATREALLRALVAPLRQAVADARPLDPAELREWSARDAARGARVTAPVAGTVEGIDEHGAVLVRTDRGVARVTSGSLVFADSAWWTTPARSAAAANSVDTVQGATEC